MSAELRRVSALLRTGRVVALAALLGAGCSDGGAASSPEGGADASTESSSGAAPDAGPQPTVTGPVTGGSMGRPFTAAPINLASFGYVEQEYFIEGSATAYAFKGTAGADGRGPSSRRPPLTTRHACSSVIRAIRRNSTERSSSNGSTCPAGSTTTPSSALDMSSCFEAGSLTSASPRRRRVWWAEGSRSVRRRSQPLVQWDPGRYGFLQAPGRRLLVRHLHAGGGGRAAPGRRRSPSAT